MDCKPISTAPKDGTEIEVRDAQGRKGLSWWSSFHGMWVSGGIHHGFPYVPELAGHDWCEWREL